MHKYKRLFLPLIPVSLIILTILLSTGIKKTVPPREPIQISDFKLNTVVSITIYDSGNEQLLENCMQLCDKYEQIFSRTAENSELYRLNHRLLPDNQVSPELSDLISEGLRYSKLSNGAFDITLAPVSSLWNFNVSNPELPDPDAVSSALSLVGYRYVKQENDRIRFAKDGMQLDLGAIAKGYIADRLKDYLVSEDVTSAIINLGGNVLCIGCKPDGTPFKVGIQKPFADRNETINTIDINGRSVVSSGIYERCFEQNGTLYHHILDSSTGFPCQNNLLSVTIISDTSTEGDALSTCCFALGLEKGSELIKSLNNIEAIFITDDYELHYVN